MSPLPLDDLLLDGRQRRRVPILITGHQRSGTGFMARLSRVMGLQIGHERLRHDGISSAYMAPPAWRVCFHGYLQNRGRLWFDCERTFIVVRDPVATVASVAFTENTNRTSLEWRAQWVPIELRRGTDTVVQATQSVVGWYRRLRDWFPDAPVLKLETAGSEFPKLLGRPVPPHPGIVNARQHEPLTWDQIRQRCGDGLAAALERHANEYGYEVDGGAPRARADGHESLGG